jgi:hypothetical protein
MALDSKAPSLAGNLVRIHKVITRGLEVASRRGAEFAQEGFPDALTQRGFADYARSLITVLDAHHLSEDEVAFPALKEKLPAAPYGRLAADHQQIEDILDEVRGMHDKSVSMLDGLTGQSLGDLGDALKRIMIVWTPHIGKEEIYFSERTVSAVMDAQEQGRINGMIAKHTQEHSSPDYLIVPFILFNLAIEDRAVMAQSMPPEIVQELVPNTWKEKWAPMKPFLLE